MASSASIAVDAYGNAYITGNFWGSVDFDPGPGTFILPAIDVDFSGNVYLTGRFHGTVDFDPGPGVFKLTSAGSADVFVTSLDGSGNFRWAHSMGGTSAEQGTAITTDEAGRLYVTGRFTGTGDFDPGPGQIILTSAGSTDVFVSRFDIGGNFYWSKQIGGASFEESLAAGIDGSGNVHVIGRFQGTCDFDPGSSAFNLTSTGSDDVFVSALNEPGEFLRAKSIGGTTADRGHAIDIDAFANIYATGVYSGTVDFHPGADVFNSTSNGGADVFVIKMNPQ